MATYSTQDGVNFNLPDEGATFRAVGDDAGQSVYQIKNGKVETLYSPITTAPYTRTTGGSQYAQQSGNQYETLGAYNMADIYSVLQKTGGVYPTSNTKQTIDPTNANGIVATDASGKVISKPNPTPQPGALTPPQNATNPNAALQTPGNMNGGQPAPGEPAVPIGQTPEQLAATVSATGQQPEVSQPAAQAAVSSYTGPSIVDYLNSVGQPSDYASRARLATQMGVQNYSGTAAQNSKLLDTLRQGQGSTASVVAHSAPPEAPSSNVNTGLLGKYGVSAPDPSQSPTLSFVDSYKQILSQFGLPDIKAQFDSVQKQYDDLQLELSGKVSDINDDPWLSQDVRDRRIKKLQSTYETKTDLLTNKLKLYDSLYKQGLDEAKFVAGKAYDQYQFDQNTQLKLYELGEKQLEAQNKIDTQVVEVGGKKVLINSDTGEVVKELGVSTPTGAQQTDSAVTSEGKQLLDARGTDGYTDPNLYARTRQNSKIGPTEFDNRFGYLVNPQSRAKLGLTATNAGGGTQFLNSDWFKKSYTTDQLYTQAQAAGKGVGLFGNKEDAVTEYLADLETTVNAYREAGFSDTDILKMMK